MVAFCLLSPLYGFGEDIEGVRKKAEAGHAGAQLDLGWMYQNGDDVLQDDSEAVKWYRKAAEQGLASAQCNLGMMFMEGRGVARDKEEALNWFRKAARKGHSLAKYNFGLAYFNGDGVSQDYAEAINWFRKAAESKDPNLRSDAIGIYQNSEFVPWFFSKRGRVAEQGSLAGKIT